MPQIGDIEKDWKLGYVRFNRKLQWLACKDCGKERWVFLVNVTERTPVHIYCLKCGLKHGKILVRPKGKDNPRWKGGRIHHNGYIEIRCNEHPRARGKGQCQYVAEHILVWEKANNQFLPKGWLIHHLNGVRDDNRIENLLALTGRKHYDLIPAYKKRIRELEEALKKCKSVNFGR